MDRSAASFQAPRAVRRSRRSYVQIEAVLLLGVRVTAYAIINEREHQRRQAAKMTSVTDPALLDRLMDLPVGIPVADPVISAETVDQLPAIVERDENGATAIEYGLIAALDYAATSFYTGAQIGLINPQLIVLPSNLLVFTP